jgi:outer membrane protein assembly factor BamE (lipoprotein component of BamABCDE complex)
MSRTLGVALVAVAVGVAPVAAAEKGKAKAETSREFTLGVVQKELRPGLSQADVAERLGSPNILTRDAEGREAWVYDKVSSDVEVSGGSVGLGGLGSGAGGAVAGVLGIGASKRSERAKSSQKTLTVVVRFSAAGFVESFTWHNSRF